MDAFAHRMANRLVGNPPEAAALDALPEAEMVDFFRKAEAYLGKTFGFVSERGQAA